MDLLPDEVLLYIITHLDLEDVCKCCLVCQRWNRLCNDKSLWRTIQLDNIHSHQQVECTISSLAQAHPSIQNLSIHWLFNRKSTLSLNVDLSFDIWKQFTQLESFHISSPIATSEWLPVIKVCDRTLKGLEIELSERFSNEHFHLIFTSPNLKLRKLSLAHCRFLDGLGMFDSNSLNVRLFGHCLQSLETLNLDGISDISDAHLCTFFSVSPHLKSLTIDGENITDSTPENISVLLPKLKHLSISFCSSLTNKALSCFAQLKFLESLHLKKNEHFSSEGFVQFSRRKPTCLSTGEVVGVMKRLSIINCPGFNDDALKPMAEVFPDLTYLDISWCYQITDLGIYSISLHCRKIEILKIVGLYVNLLHILDNPMPTLRVLDLEQSGSVIDSQLWLLKLARPWIDITDYYGSKV